MTSNNTTCSVTSVDDQHAQAFGVRVVLQQHCGRATYSKNSGSTTNDGATFFPLEDWSKPMLVPLGVRAPLCSAVTTFDLGPELYKSLRKVLPNLLDTKASSDHERRATLNNFADEVCVAMNILGVATEEIRVCNVAVNPPGAKSTGRDFEKNVYVGMHIDDHDKLPLESRADAIQLLAINCSAADRHFHYIDSSVDELLSMCETVHDLTGPRRLISTASPSEQLKNRFFMQFSDRPVVRVTLPPGHAYVATPQNIIHDGAAGSDQAADVAFLMLGRFELISPKNT